MAIARRFGQKIAARVLAAMALVIALVATMGLAAAPRAAADPTATMQIEKSAQVDGDLSPGTEFLYTITVTCSATTVAGCDNFVLTDPLP